VSNKVDGQGERKNSDKIPLELVPPSLVFAVGEVLRVGAQKYSARNWERGMKWTTVLGCLLRHVYKWASPFESDFDEESGLSHLWHAAANVAMLIEYDYTCKNLDDRTKYDLPSKVVHQTNITENDLEQMWSEQQESSKGRKGACNE
jgi:hypothetical protein